MTLRKDTPNVTRVMHDRPAMDSCLSWFFGSMQLVVQVAFQQERQRNKKKPFPYGGQRRMISVDLGGMLSSLRALSPHRKQRKQACRAGPRLPPSVPPSFQPLPRMPRARWLQAKPPFLLSLLIRGVR